MSGSPQETTRLEFRGGLESVSDFVLSAVKSYYNELSEDDVFRLRFCLQEAMVNAVRHGRGTEGGQAVRVELARRHDRITVTVSDRGEGFDPGAVPDPTLPENFTRPRGRGLYMVRRLADEVDFFDGGRTVRMTFRRPDSRNEG